VSTRRFPLLLAALATATVAQAQDTLSLRALHDAAIARDARSGAATLIRQQGALRDRVIASDRYAQPQFNAQATHQSDVTQLPLRVPGTDIPTPPFTRYQVSLDLDQPLYDAGSVNARRAVERTRTNESEADLRARVYGITFEVNATVFTLLLQQEQQQELRAVRRALEQRLAETRLRVSEGVALGRDTSALLAEQLRVDELLDLVVSKRAAAASQLASLTGRTVSAHTPIALANMAGTETLPSAPVDALRLRERPEFARFDATRARLAEEANATAVDARPRVSAFVQAGMGQPGLNQLRPDSDAFYIAGVRAAWRPFASRDAERRAEQLRVQQRITDLEEKAFAEMLARASTADAEEIERLTTLIERDVQVIAARTEIERVARLELDEGLTTTAQWITVQTDLAEARIAAKRHTVELALARARLFTTLGLPLP
jgi:outer membrane protein TolC